MSVLFDFNASLSDVAPVSPMSFPVDLMRIEKSGLFTCAIFRVIALYSPLRSS